MKISQVLMALAVAGGMSGYAAMPERGICAHRGDRAEYPEDTVIAIEAAVKKGAAMVEFDVVPCKTGELIVIHDDTVDRTTDGSGAVADLTFDEIRALDAGVKFGGKFKGTKIPTLDEVLAVMPKDGTWFNVHCRDSAAAEAARRLKAKGLLDVAFIATGADGVKAAKAAVPEVKICGMGGTWKRWKKSDTEKYFRFVIGCGSSFCQPHMVDLSAADVKEFKAKGGKVNYFWVNDPARLASAYAAGVDFPLTDRLSVMLAKDREIRASGAITNAPAFRTETRYAGDGEFAPSTSDWRDLRVAVLGDSISDPRWQCTFNTLYWQFLSKWLAWDTKAYAVNGHQWTGIPGQTDKAIAEMGDDVDAFLIFVGTNDYSSGAPLGEWFTEEEGEVNWWGKTHKLKHRTLSKDPKTVRGRINIALEKIRKRYPDSQVVIMTPIKRGIFAWNHQADEDWTNTSGTRLEDYVKVIREGAELWGCPVVDLYAEAPLLPRLADEYSKLYRSQAADMLHPNTEGHRRLAEVIYRKLQSIPSTFRRWR